MYNEVSSYLAKPEYRSVADIKEVSMGETEMTTGVIITYWVVTS